MTLAEKDIALAASLEFREFGIILLERAALLVTALWKKNMLPWTRQLM